jgi:protein arginine kinase activator
VASKRHLCSQCASETELGRLFDKDNSFAKLLSGILGLNTASEEDADTAASSLTCPNCHTTFGDFIKNGRFGCAECYDTFGLLIHDNIKKLQGSDTHTGKRPKYIGEGREKAVNPVAKQPEENLREQLEILTAKQQEAVADEDYEAAARFRDEIKSIRERMKIDHEMV